MDFDGDGISDLLTGSWPGELYFFKGEGKGKFARAETLKDKGGKVIKLGSASTVFACDWRGSGKLDLLVGDIQGHAWLIANEGTRTKPVYGKGVKLQAGDKDIRVPDGDSHPVLADWDGGGTPGLVIGCGDGSVVWHKNIGTRTEPKLAAARTLLAAPPQSFTEDKPTKELGRGIRAKVWVGDWNGDGHLDLLVGDFAMTFGDKPKMTAADEALQKETKDKLTKLQKELAPLLQEEYIKLFEDKPDETAAQKTERVKQQEKKLQEKFKDKLDEQDNLYETLRKFQPPHFYHGHVWLYLRQPPEKTSVR